MAVISNDRNALGRASGPTEIELINIITVEPEDQQAIVDTVSEILEDIAEKQPGFISFKVYKSLDRTRVAYFIRWRSQDEGLAWFEDIRDALKVSKSRVKNADYHLYEVIEDVSL